MFGSLAFFQASNFSQKYFWGYSDLIRTAILSIITNMEYCGEWGRNAIITRFCLKDGTNLKSEKNKKKMKRKTKCHKDELITVSFFFAFHFIFLKFFTQKIPHFTPHKFKSTNSCIKLSSMSFFCWRVVFPSRSLHLLNCFSPPAMNTSYLFGHAQLDLDSAFVKSFHCEWIRIHTTFRTKTLVNSGTNQH